jgi:hypothetical protein
MTVSARTPEMECLKSGLKQIRTTGESNRFSRYINGTVRTFYERLRSCGRSPPRRIGCHVN